jgi:thymidylate synthase (FAD)
MGDDLSVVRAARVSYAAAWRAGTDQGSDTKLINYLWVNEHTSPFESVTFTFEVKAPIFVIRQWQRHRTWSYSELSARYRELPEEFYIPSALEIGKQATNNKQARTLSEITNEERLQRDQEASRLRSHCQQAFGLYKNLLDAGWPRELARIALPLGTYSHMLATVNLLNLFRFCSLRSHAHAQQEIRIYSDALIQLVRPLVPVCVAAWAA